MTTLLEAAQQAMKALNTCDSSVGLAGERQWFDSNSVDRAITALTTALAEQSAEQEPVAEQPASLDWVSLNKAADEIVRSKPTWRRFIDGTPLANDIACWMADFALEHTAPQPAKQPLTDDEIDVLWARQQTKPFKTHAEDRMAFARAIEAAHGIRSLE